MDIEHVLFWVCCTLCAVAESLILRAAFQPVADATTASAVPRSPRAIEILWGILPAFALAAVFWAVWHRLP